MNPQQQRYCLFACEVLRRELDSCRERSAHRVDARYLDQGLHDLGAEGVRRALREELEQVDAAAYDALLLGYGLCNNGIVGLSHPTLPLVAPRAHDCVALFLGSHQRYEKYFQQVSY